MSDKECTCYEFTDGHQAGCPMNRTGLTTDRIAEIRERASRATAHGDLKLDPYPHGGGRASSRVSRELVLDAYDADNRAFYFNAASDIPYLLAQLDAARAEVERLRARVEAAETLANRAYPGMKVSGLCSKHHPSNPQRYDCSTCFPDLNALIKAHCDLKQQAWQRLHELGEKLPGIDGAVAEPFVLPIVTAGEAKDGEMGLAWAGHGWYSCRYSRGWFKCVDAHGWVHELSNVTHWLPAARVPRPEGAKL